jgi:hypothetical protein
MKQQLVSRHKEKAQEQLLETKSKTKSKSKSKSKQLEIDLEKIHTPHPAVVEAYKDTDGQFFPYDENPACLNEKRLFLYSKASKQPIKHRIVSLYRKRDFSGTEFCFFQEHLSTRDLFGNYLDHTREMGRYELPHIVKQMGYNPNSTPDPAHPEELGPQMMAAEIESVEQVYEWEFEKLKPWLKEQRSKGIIRDDCNFTAWIGQKKYSVQDWDSFINLSFENLVLLNRTNIDSMGLGLDANEILQMAREKAREKLTKSIGEEVKHSAVNRG